MSPNVLQVSLGLIRCSDAGGAGKCGDWQKKYGQTNQKYQVWLPNVAKLPTIVAAEDHYRNG